MKEGSSTGDHGTLIPWEQTMMHHTNYKAVWSPQTDSPFTQEVHWYSPPVFSGELVPVALLLIYTRLRENRIGTSVYFVFTHGHDSLINPSLGLFSKDLGWDSLMVGLQGRAEAPCSVVRNHWPKLPAQASSSISRPMSPQPVSLGLSHRSRIRS